MLTVSKLRIKTGAGIRVRSDNYFEASLSRCPEPGFVGDGFMIWLVEWVKMEVDG